MKMIKMMTVVSILLIMSVLLSGCIGSKSNKAGDSKDEYADDGTSEDIDQIDIQTQYDDLNINNGSTRTRIFEDVETVN